MTPATVKVVSGATRSVPPPAPSAMARDVVRLAVVHNVPPFSVTPSAAAPRLVSLATRRLVLVTMVPPA